MTRNSSYAGHSNGREVFTRYWNLILYKTYSELRAESQRTYVGFAWWVIEPIVSMAVYYLVFKVIFDRGTEHFVPFLFVGLVPWRWLSTGTMHGANAILSERSLMQQVHLSKIVFPLVSVLTDTVKFLAVMVIVLAFVVISGFEVGIFYLGLPVVMVVQFLLILGLTILFATLTPFLPDLRIVLSNLIRLWFFMSGIFWDIKSLPEQMQYYLRLNPMTVIIEAYRDILLYESWPDLERLFFIGSLSAALCVLAISLLRHYDYVYPKLQF